MKKSDTPKATAKPSTGGTSRGMGAATKGGKFTKNG